MSSGAISRLRHRSWHIVAVLATVTICQFGLALFSIEVLSAVRAYVLGESLYSKAQKGAQIALLNYFQSHREEDYQQVLAELAGPLGDRMAREELEKPSPDMARVRSGFLQGGNSPSDIDGLVWLYRWFGRSSWMAGAIAQWSAGDRAIAELLDLAKRAHVAVRQGASAEAMGELRDRSVQINARLTALELEFSRELADASRAVRRSLLGLNLCSAALLGAAGVAMVRLRLRERARAELEISRRHEFLQQLLDSAAEGLFGVDLQGRCTFINRSALQLLGVQATGDVVGRDMHALLHPGGTCAGESCPLRRSLALQRATHAPEETFRTAGGGSVRVEFWSHPFYQGGTLSGVVVTFFDIGEQVRIRDALRKTEARMARLVDTVADAVIALDANRRIVLFNRAAETIFRAPASELIGRGIGELLDEATVLADVAAPGGKVHEVQGRRFDGEVFPAEVSVASFESEQGAMTTIILRDMSQREAVRREREARQAIEASSRAKMTFLSRMSHELRTPLNAVLGFARLMSLDRQSPLDVRNAERVARIESAGRHLLALVNDVLDLSRVEAGEMSLSLESVDVLSVSDEAMSVVASAAREGGVTLHMAADAVDDAATAGADGPVRVLADQVRLRQVLINLLSNAVKYTPRGGRVELIVRPAGPVCKLVIADTGIGMTEEQVAHLFEPFNRLGAERSAIEGTGIGLVLTRHLVELMQGVLNIASTHGRGTVATVTLLQRQEADARIEAPRAEGVVDDRCLPGLDVLYVEDNEVNVELVRQVVTLRSGIRLRIAHDGATALRMARLSPPELMLVDMHLGDMTGIELAARLRQEVPAASMHMVALSADALPEQIRAALDEGFEEYLTKPIDFDKLLRVLDACSRAAFYSRSALSRLQSARPY